MATTCDQIGVYEREVCTAKINKNGKIKYYFSTLREQRVRKIGITEKDFNYFMALVAEGKTPNEAANEAKIALSSAMKMVFERYVEDFKKRTVT